MVVPNVTRSPATVNGGRHGRPALSGAQVTARLQEAKSPPGRCTHVVGLTAPEQVDAELQGWLVEAYAAAGPGR